MNPPLPHPAAWSSERLLQQCTITRTRRSGPGGQHRNKVETAIVIEHTPSGLRAEASERRSQAQNLSLAIFRLRVRLALELRTQPDPTLPPSLLWQSRCRGGRLQINPTHEDFPALLAEALDHLLAPPEVSAGTVVRLGCTHSQLLKLLRLAPPALEQLNARRSAENLPPWK